MISNYIKLAWRNLMKNKIFSFINVFGLATGLTCCILIAVFVYDELNYDRYPAEAANIYRVGLNVTANGEVSSYPSVDVSVGPGIKDAFPEVLAYTRLVSTNEIWVRHADKQFKEGHLAFVDSNFLEIFSIPFLEGDPATALKEPNTVVVTETFAKKYFGNDAALGKLISLGEGKLHKVTGVIGKIPVNSHFHMDAFISSATLPHANNHTWSNVGWFTYLLLARHTDVKKLEAELPGLAAKHVIPEIQQDMGVSLAEAQKTANTFRFFLQPLTDIHLHATTRYELEPNGDIHYVYIFGTLALFILLLACVNFTNLSIASACKRGKEVGIRKVMGSLKYQLISQFLAESILLSLAATLLAYLFTLLLLPYFNGLSGKQIGFDFFTGYSSMTAILLLGLLVGIVAGTYPAFFLSSFNTINVLKGLSTVRGSSNNILRSGLIVFQFTISTGLIISTLVVHQQLHYMQNKKTGYDKEQVVYLQDTYLLGNNEPVFRQQLAQDSRVINASISNNVPGNPKMDGSQIYAKENAEAGNRIEIQADIYHVDYDYLSTLGIQLVKGRNFSRDFSTDTASVMINEAAVRELGLTGTNPLGKTIVRSGQRQLKVIGVVSDFHYTSVKQKIEPLLLMLGNNGGGILIKVKTEDMEGFLADVKKQWDTFKAAGVFTYYFLDDKFAALYATEQRTGKIFTVFAILSIIIASLGLFGLSAFVIEQRNREIGIRKVLGASMTQVLVLVSKEFLLLVLIAFLISIPVTAWIMHAWLQDFAYRVSISIWVFLMSGAIAVLIALVALSFQALKTAQANPVKSLRTQ